MSDEDRARLEREWNELVKEFDRLEPNEKPKKERKPKGERFCIWVAERIFGFPILDDLLTPQQHYEKLEEQRRHEEDREWSLKYQHPGSIFNMFAKPSGRSAVDPKPRKKSTPPKGDRNLDNVPLRFHRMGGCVAYEEWLNRRKGQTNV